jgi:hypothetical protein
MGVVEQWIYRGGDRVPAISLKRSRPGWTANILNTSGISCVALDVDEELTLDEAKTWAVAGLQLMGWEVLDGKAAEN